jgi:pimeloyl-ACP methyl ester carboxylesterase
MASPKTNPVALIHGWAGSFQNTWQKPGIDALLEDMGRNVVGVDLLGHGTQEKPQEPQAYEELPAWLLSQLSPHHSPVDVVGFSLGALTVLRCIIDAPERFGKVVLAGIGDSVFEKSLPDANKRIIDALEGRAPEDDTFARMFSQYGNQAGNDLAALTAIMKRKPSEPVAESTLNEINNKVLIVIGDKDFTWPAQRLADAFPNGRLVVLKNTDHFATTESFAFIDAILEFFES